MYLSNRLAVVALFILGCAHKPPPPTAEIGSTDQIASSPGPASKAVTEPVVSGCMDDDGCASNELCQNEQCVPIVADLISACLTDTHFDFNQAVLRAEDREHLRRTARCMKVLPELHVTIAGNCDERGTEEYNLALGDRRAEAVKQYLQALSVPENTIQTVSYGKLRPLCEAHVETCWWQNRRATMTRTELIAQRAER